MQVDRTHVVAKRRRATARPAAAAAIPPFLTIAPKHVASGLQLPTSPAHTYRTFPIPNPTKAGGEWEIDWERAHAEAEKVLDAIDFSKRDIVVWVPGTSNHGVQPAFAAAVRDSYRGQGSNVVAVEYEASWHLRRSLPTGIATLRLVLQGIAARGGDHRVLLAGESQGAWIIGEAMADPTDGKVVDRAILVGHPWLAKHQYTAGEDPRVRVVNHAGDQVALPVNGDPTVALDAMIAIRTLGLSKVGDVVTALSANPKHGVELLKSLLQHIPVVGGLIRDPHVYDNEMTRAVEYLRTGDLPLVSGVVATAPAASTASVLAGFAWAAAAA
ncbi:MAG: hypothetical protein JWM98_813 [Thermoleophilia bacterium]|nr:hypothetical protein [Thermoleophilia bacterium]